MSFPSSFLFEPVAAIALCVRQYGESGHTNGVRLVYSEQNPRVVFAFDQQEMTNTSEPEPPCTVRLKRDTKLPMLDSRL